MSDIDTLERDILAGVESAADEGALEAVRVAALGKKGSSLRAPQDARRDGAGRAQGARGVRSTRSRPASKPLSPSGARC